MRSVIRRALGIGGVLLAMLAAAGAATAQTSSGPRLAFVSLLNGKTGTVRLETVDPSGTGRGTVLKGPLEDNWTPTPFFAPSWSPDGTQLAFSAYAPKAGIHQIAADGHGLRAVSGARGGTNPVFSPDGNTLAFARSRFRSHIDIHHPGRTRFYASTSAWVVDINGGGSRRLTPWRNGLEYTPTSFSPDGSVLALTKNDHNLDGPRAVLMNLADGSSTVLAREAAEPVISPDGTRAALIGSAGDLYVIGIDGTQLTRLTRSPDQTESRPSWDPSGKRIAYNRSRTGDGLDELFPFGNAIMEINVDGTCPTTVLSTRRLALYGAAWQPGPGREAGPIAC